MFLGGFLVQKHRLLSYLTRINKFLSFVDVTAKATRVLLALVIPGHLIFMYTIAYMKAGHTSITWTFASFYLTAAMLQVQYNYS